MKRLTVTAFTLLASPVLAQNYDCTSFSPDRWSCRETPAPGQQRNDQIQRGADQVRRSLEGMAQRKADRAFFTLLREQSPTARRFSDAELSVLWETRPELKAMILQEVSAAETEKPPPIHNNVRLQMVERLLQTAKTRTQARAMIDAATTDLSSSTRDWIRAVTGEQVLALPDE